VTDRSAITEGLIKRIVGSKIWATKNQGAEIEGMELRGHPAKLKVIQFLDDDRVEANGIRFRLFFGKEKMQFFADLDVRINPNWVMAEGKDDTAPYIVLYVLDKKGAGDSLKWFYVIEQDQLCEDLEMGEWYLSFIKRSIRPGADGKIMIHRSEVESA
jgi:hypothetical protein